MSLQHDHANALLMSSLARRGGDEVGAELWWHEAERIGLALDVELAATGRHSADLPASTLQP